MREIWKKESRENSDTYDRLAKEHGAGHRAADWGSAKSQALRFRILSECGLSPDDSVLDVGCGLGDFYAWLKAHGYRGQYTGIDISQEAVRLASEKHRRAKFAVGDIADDKTLKGSGYDLVVASGIFAKRPESGQDYLNAMVARMFTLARRAAAFNSLSSWGSSPEPGEFCADPVETLQYCRRLTPWLALRTDYHPHDFTVYLYKSRT
jgi:SAM-dependent methyltransferase